MILVAVPTYESIMPDTFKSLWDMDRGGLDVEFEFVRGYDCAKARGDIARLALDRGAEHVLMVDSDIVVPRNALADLLSNGVDVCLGYYANRDDYGGVTCVYKTGQHDYVERYTAADFAAARASGDYLVRVKGGGLGCALVRTSVFGRIGYPWFSYVVYADGHGVLSEDLHFCEQLARAGIPVHADARVGCGHFFRHREDVM